MPTQFSNPMFTSIGRAPAGGFLGAALKRKAKKGYDWGKSNTYQTLFGNATQAEMGKSAQIEDATYDKAAAFDPAAAYKEYMGGARSAAEDSLGTQLKAMAGQAVGQGRLDTGFYDLDQGDVARNVWADYGRTMSGAALQTAGMQQQQNFGMLDYGAQRRNRYFDLLASGYDRSLAKENAKQARKGGFLKTLGKIGGAVLGSVAGPVGTALGGKIAGSIFK